MKVGSVCYATEQGLSRLMKSFYDAGVVGEVMVFRHPGGRPECMGWYPPGTPLLTSRPFAGPEVDGFLDRIDVLLCFESPLDWSLLPRCRARGVRTAVVTMYEWWPLRPPHGFDLYLCPSLLDLEYFPRDRSVFLPVPGDPSSWRPRESASRYLHNAGWIGSRNHKGTDLVLRALPLCEAPLSLTVRCQDEAGLARLLAACPEAAADPRLAVESGTRPYEALFGGFDVLVQPERYNGLSLPLQEAFAAGLLVMTSNRHPHNTWLPHGPLVPVAGYRKVRVAPGYTEIDEAVVEPAAVAAAMDCWHGRDITAHSLCGKNWAEAHSWAELRPKYLEALGALCAK